ncbi:MAG: DUF3500 domain-containing protein [Cyclobacteriaceae bacterium]
MIKYIFSILIFLIVNCTGPVLKEENKTEAQKEVNPVKQRFAKREAEALKEPYRGIYVNSDTLNNLFPIRATNISTEPIKNAAEAFLNSLTKAQLDKTTYPIDDQEWRKWSNVDNGIYDRQGVSLKEMTEAQKKVAFGLMQNSLSAKGLQLSKDIMKTDQTLRELNNRSDAFDEELYFFSIMGKPSITEPWGWQLDGHHLIINYFILGDQIVMSPVFMGAEPVVTTTGKYTGNTLFQDEQNIGLAFMQSLTAKHQELATISKSKEKNNNIASANKDNLTLEYEGFKVSLISESQKKDLSNLIFQYISNMREGHQQVKMEEVEEHMDNTYFAWVGETTEDAVFYYRIHSPVVLIEFDHQRVVGVPNVDRKKPSRNHIHTVVRTPNGNDYGKDLLRQHLEKHKH